MGKLQGSTELTRKIKKSLQQEYSQETVIRNTSQISIKGELEVDQ